MGSRGDRRRVLGVSSAVVRGVSVAVCLLGLLAGRAEAQATGSITGTVFDSATKAGLSGGYVVAVDSLGDLVAFLPVAANGTYVVRNLAAGTYFLTTQYFDSHGYTNHLYKDMTCARYIGCAALLGTPVTVTAGATTSGIDFTLETPGVITGTMVTQPGNGTPPAGWYVTARAEDGYSAGSVSINNDGRYTITRLPPGQYTLVATAPDFLTETYPGKVTVTSASTTAGVDFSLLPTGTIAGKVIDAATNAPLAGVIVRLYNIFGQEVGASTSRATPATENYSLVGLLPGTYFVRTSNAMGYLDELYSDAPCPGDACTIPSGTPVQVTSGVTTRAIDFALTIGSRITGTVTEEGTGTPLSGVSVSVHDANGIPVATARTDAAGAYSAAVGHPTGSFFVRTSATLHLDELYGGQPCPIVNCVVTTGTAVVAAAGSVQSGIDFALPRGGTIAGTVTTTGGTGISNATITAFDASGVEVGLAEALSDGTYVLSKLATGVYYLRTGPTHYHKGPSFATEYLHEVYNDVPCPEFSVPVCTPTSGHAVAVTTGAATTNIDFSLARLDATGRIAYLASDAVTNKWLSPVILVYDSTGTLIRSNANSGGSVSGLPAGTYYVRARAPGYFDRLYDVSCPQASCPATMGTPVTVTAGAATSIELRLSAAGRIAGVITNAATHAPVGGVRVVAHDATGAEITETTTDSGGRYVLGWTAPGLSGTHFVRTAATGYLDQQHRGRPCVDGACVATITNGTAIAVTPGVVTYGVDFALVRREITATPATLHFGATKSPGSATVLAVTAPQMVMVDFTSDAGAWTATASEPWLQLTGNAGVGPGRFTVAVVNPSDVIGEQTTLSGTITLTPTAGNLPVVTIPVTLRVRPPAAQTAPFGMFETPAAGATVAGSIAVTGWALDDLGIARVELWRDKVPGETTPGFSGGGLGDGKIFIATASLVAGARPDVETAYATLPQARRAGWGYLLLTQGLWNQGNGTYTLHAFAYDDEGNGVSLGSKTITVNNAAATLPFGSIDTPAPGETVTTSFWNYGWALTPNATPTCTIPASGVQVSIDSGPLQPVSYGDNRTDIAAAFPGYTNTNGAGGAYYIDTTTLANGTHQIGWLVTDNCNRAEGIGSRFFTVFNGGADSTAADSTDSGSTAADLTGSGATAADLTGSGATAADLTGSGSTAADSTDSGSTAADLTGSGSTAADLTGARSTAADLTGSGSTAADFSTPRAPKPQAPRPKPIKVRRGLETTVVTANPAGRYVVPIAQGERVEVVLPAVGGSYAGRGLPLGSSLDAVPGIFYWQPAPGFLGAHDLEFVASSGETVRVRAIVGTAVQAVIDTPSPNNSGGDAVGLPVTSSFTIAGWAIDEAATAGTGIDAVHVWAHPVDGMNPIFLGVAQYGGERADIGALFGDQFTASSFTLAAENLAPGDYDIVVYPRSAVVGDFHGAQVVRVSVQ